MQLSIGERISLSRIDKELIVKISGKMESWMTMTLVFWLVLWTAAGAYVCYYLLAGKTQGDQSWFFVTYLVFWGYFEYKALHSFLYHQFGFEIMKVTPSEVLIKQDILGFGRTRKYVRENIGEWERVTHDRKSYSAAFSKSYWVVGNQQLQFLYLGKMIGFGMHLSPEDRDKLLMSLRKEWKRVK